MSVNKVILVGNVGTKPEMSLMGPVSVARFRLATNEKRRKSPDSREFTEITEWHNIVMRDKAAEIAERYIETGTKLYVEGKLRTRSYTDRNGLERRITEIVVEEFDILARPQHK